jgi:hypothetical protein
MNVDLLKIARHTEKGLPNPHGTVYSDTYGGGLVSGGSTYKQRPNGSSQHNGLSLAAGGHTRTWDW